MLAAPDVSEAEETDTFRLLSLDALVHMKLTSFRDRDRVHLRDLIEVGPWMIRGGNESPRPCNLGSENSSSRLRVRSLPGGTARNTPRQRPWDPTLG